MLPLMLLRLLLLLLLSLLMLLCYFWHVHFAAEYNYPDTCLIRGVTIGMNGLDM